MARQVRNKMVWGEGCDVIAEKSGFSNILGSILGFNHRVNESTSSIGYGHVTSFEAHFGSASVKQVEALVRRGRTLQ